MILDFGFWILDFGFWILDFGVWILEFGFWILDQFSLRSFFGGPKRRRLDFGFWILDFGFWSLNFGFWSLDFGFWILVWMRPQPTSFGSCIRYFHVTPTRVGGFILLPSFHTSTLFLGNIPVHGISCYFASLQLQTHSQKILLLAQHLKKKVVKASCLFRKKVAGWFVGVYFTWSCMNEELGSLEARDILESGPD